MGNMFSLVLIIFSLCAAEVIEADLNGKAVINHDLSESVYISHNYSDGNETQHFQRKYTDEKDSIPQKSYTGKSHKRTLLYDYVLKSYQKQALPHDPENGPVNVSFAMTVMDFDYDMHRSSLNVHCWLEILWKDPRLKWNASEWANITSIRIDPTQIWVPDIHLYNNGNNGKSDMFDTKSTSAVVDFTGDILWVPATQMIAMCKEDVTSWPWDRQDCDLKFGSWTYDGLELNLLMRDRTDIVDTSSYDRDHRWKIIKKSSKRNSVTYACCPEPYLDITVSILLERQSAGLQSILVSTALGVSILALLAFWLHPLPRVVVSCVNLMIIVAHLLYFAVTLPLRTHLPRIAHFYICSFILVLVSLIMMVISSFLSTMSIFFPDWMNRCLSSRWTKFLCIPSSSSESKPATIRLYEEGEQPDESDERSTRQLGTLLDRMLFFIFLLVFVFMLMAYF